MDAFEKAEKGLTKIEQKLQSAEAVWPSLPIYLFIFKFVYFKNSSFGLYVYNFAQVINSGFPDV